MDEDCENGCPPACQSVFDRVVVRHHIKGGTRVYWELLPSFTDRRPLTFQLQAGNTASHDAGDWEDVGTPVVDAYSAVDPEQRAWGKRNATHYRVKVTSSLGEHYSDPSSGMGVLSRRDWLTARELVRQRLVEFRVGFAAQDGYLLKRRWTGTRCPRCLDLQTLEVRDGDCPECYGTGFESGYYFPVACVWAKLGLKSYRTELDGGQSRGTIDDVTIKADMLMTDLLGEDDVWVARKTDDRYYVHRVTHTAEVRGVPVSADVELRLIPYTSRIYEIPVPNA